MTEDARIDPMQGRITVDDLDPENLAQLSDDDFRAAMLALTELQELDRKQNQLVLYQPASDDCLKVHRSRATYLLVCGGNGASKTDTVLAHMAALCTGIIPESIPEIKTQFRGPINCRVVVESFTTTLNQIILKKLQWNQWQGVSFPGGDQGHWGWVPKSSLIDGDWQTSYSEKYRTLRMLCRDPDNPLRVLGESTIQFMSHEQDPSDFASGDFHIVMFDEPTKYAIWTENQARTMRVNGRMILSMTWPDDPAIPVDWIFDEVYEKGIPGPRKSPDHEVIELSTRKNKNLDQKSISRQSENWSEATRNVRILGKPIRFSNRIHALFTDTPNYWSFTANEVVEPEWSDEGRALCPKTGSIEVTEFCHVRVVDPSSRWPHVFLIDPHPRKATMFCWVQIDPDDDYCMVLSHQMTGTCKDIATFVADIEDQFSLQVRLRLMDPNMAEQPAAASRDMETSWRDEYATAGLICDLASDSSVGRKRLDEYLTPDRYTYRPRFTIAQGNDVPIEQMKRYVWDDHKRALERDQKQLPKTKYDDYPTMFKYLMNAQPQFRHLLDGPQVLHREGMRPPPPDSHRR